jgi:hypothetical protein
MILPYDANLARMKFSERTAYGPHDGVRGDPQSGFSKLIRRIRHGGPSRSAAALPVNSTSNASSRENPPDANAPASRSRGDRPIANTHRPHRNVKTWALVKQAVYYYLAAPKLAASGL